MARANQLARFAAGTRAPSMSLRQRRSTAFTESAWRISARAACGASATRRSRYSSYARAVSDATRDGYDRIARAYAHQLFDELAAKPRDRELLARLATQVQGEICDLGCGPEQIARFLHDAGATTFGLDLSPQMVAEARARSPGLRFDEGDMLALPLASHSIAGIAAFYAIVNLPPEVLPQAFAEMHRVLAPGGTLLVAFHVGRDVVPVDTMFEQATALTFYFFEVAAIRALLEGAGFTIDEVIERGPYAPDVEHQSRRAYIFARAWSTK